jgi:hypothetical protein
VRRKCWIVSIGPVVTRRGRLPATYAYIATPDPGRPASRAGAVEAALASFRRDYPGVDLRGSVTVLEGSAEG